MAASSQLHNCQLSSLAKQGDNNETGNLQVFPTPAQCLPRRREQLYHFSLSYSLCPIAGLQIYSPSYDSATSQLDFRQYEGLLRSPDLEPDAFRHEAVSARRIYEFKSYRDGQVSVERLRDLASRNLGT